MPCRTDHMEQTPEEKFFQDTAKLIMFVLNRQNKFIVKQGRREIGGIVPKEYKWIESEANAMYANDRRLEPFLCGLIKNMDEDELNKIVYNGRDKDSRKLANWWEAHQEADKAREIADKWNKELSDLKKQALRKLTNAEKKALGLI